MLPVTFFDRLLSPDASPIQTVQVERRQAVRYAFRAPAQLHPTLNHKITSALPVIIEDLSRSGLRIVLPSPTNLAEDWSIIIGNINRTTDKSAILLCSTIQSSARQDGSIEVGAKIVSILAPWQLLCTDRVIQTYVWIECDRTTPEDPILTSPSAIPA